MGARLRGHDKKYAVSEPQTLNFKKSQLTGSDSSARSRLAALKKALNALVTIDINVAEVIDAYVEIDIYSQQHSDGAKNMGKNDLWIAACAKASGAALLTTDKDFDHLNPDLLSVEYVDPTSAFSS
jgi:predicted nucleic acid-binding protein